MGKLERQIDVLGTLVLPDRYETLKDHVGAQVAQLLLPPSPALQEAVRRLVDGVKRGKEGALVPLFGDSGAGKTTIAENIHIWEPDNITQTVTFNGAIAFEELTRAVGDFRRSLAANDQRVVAINIDHRESAPPTDHELSTIKRFLRTSPAGVP